MDSIQAAYAAYSTTFQDREKMDEEELKSRTGELYHAEMSPDVIIPTLANFGSLGYNHLVEEYLKVSPTEPSSNISTFLDIIASIGIHNMISNLQDDSSRVGNLLEAIKLTQIFNSSSALEHVFVIGLCMGVGLMIQPNSGPKE